MFRPMLALAAAAFALAGCAQSGGVPQTIGPDGSHDVTQGAASGSTLSEASRVGGNAPSYQLVILGNGLVPAKINDRGVVVGTNANTNQPFVYKHGKIAYLPLFPGDEIGAAYDVNNHDQIVGYSENLNDDGLFPTHAVSWTRGRPANLGSTSGYTIPNTNVAQVINDDGEIAGQSGPSAEGGVFPLAIFVPSPVRFIDHTTGVTFGINNAGEIVGVDVLPLVLTSSPFSYPNPIVCSPPLDATGTILGINNAGDTISTLSNTPASFLCAKGVGHNVPLYASGINDRDDIVGDASAAQSMLYSAGKLYDVKFLTRSHPDIARFQGTLLKGVRDYRSSDGAVHGVVFCVSPGDAVLYSNGKLYDLNDLVQNHPGIVLQNAVSINNRREIVGTYMTNGSPVGYLLRPR